MKAFYNSIIAAFSILISLNVIQSDSSFNKIPAPYISDKNFLDMALKSQPKNVVLYAAPKGHGDSCTANYPCVLEKAVTKLKAGYTLYLKEGTYNVKKGITIEAKGKANSYITISSAPNEKAIISSECNKKNKNECPEVTLFFLEEGSSYIIIENLIFQNAKAKVLQGIVFYGGGQSHIIIRKNVFNSLSTTVSDTDGYLANGILLTGEDSGIDNVIIYKNQLMNNNLGYSEAISIEGNCRYIYVLNNTLTNNNNIGIDFNGNTCACDKASLDQPRKSVAMYNIVDKSVAKYDECAGIYVDGAKEIFIYKNKVSNSQYGIEIGAEENKDHKNPITDIIVESNNLIANTLTGIRVGGFEKDLLFVKNTTFKNNKISKSKTSIIIAKADGISFVENEIYDATNYFVEMEFSKKETKNVSFNKNTFSGTGKFKLVGYDKDLTLNQFVNLYKTNKIKN